MTPQDYEQITPKNPISLRNNDHRDSQFHKTDLQY